MSWLVEKRDEEIAELRRQLAEALSYQANYEHATKLEREEHAEALAEAQQAREDAIANCSLVEEQLQAAETTAVDVINRLRGERDTYARLLKEMFGFLDSAWAATWDRYYGKGLSAEYARSVSSQLTSLKDKISATLAGVSEPASERIQGGE